VGLILGRNRLANVPAIKEMIYRVHDWVILHLDFSARTPDGCLISVDPFAIHGNLIFATGADEGNVTNLERRFLNPGMNAVDIGANVGYHTVLIAKLVGPAGKVYAFEPDDRNLRLLRRNLRNNGLYNVSVQRSICTDSDGEVTFFVARSDTESGSLVYRQKTSKPARRHSVSLDKFFSSNPEAISYIKMDIEGSEQLALRGMHEVLRKNPSLIIVMEYNPRILRNVWRSPDALLLEAANLQLNPFKISDSGGLMPTSYPVVRGLNELENLAFVRDSEGNEAVKALLSE